MRSSSVSRLKNNFFFFYISQNETSGLLFRCCSFLIRFDVDRCAVCQSLRHLFGTSQENIKDSALSIHSKPTQVGLIHLESFDTFFSSSSPKFFLSLCCNCHYVWRVGLSGRIKSPIIFEQKKVYNGRQQLHKNNEEAGEIREAGKQREKTATFARYLFLLGDST